MTKEQFAKLITGRSLGDELSKEEDALAKKNGLMVVFGASDDLIEFQGACYDEQSAPGGFLVSPAGFIYPEMTDDDREVLERHGVLAAAKLKRAGAIKVEALWCAEKNGPDWTYLCSVPVATFDVMDDDSVYCRGIVIMLEEMKNDED